VIGVVGQLEILVGSSSRDGLASALTPGSDAGALPRPIASRYRNVGAYTSSFGGGRHEGTGTFG
jgi:hypothetical protein